MAKTRATFLIPEEVVKEARNAVAFLAGPPLHLTLGQLAEDALREKLADLQKEFNKGAPFPEFKGRSGRGRPVGS
jgi:hypothetical protein